jgi:hypothetical protein
MKTGKSLLDNVQHKVAQNQDALTCLYHTPIALPKLAVSFCHMAVRVEKIYNKPSFSFMCCRLGSTDFKEGAIL